uniref:Galectin n=1 Tax=Plectus sambesii TaxID=2011161 RepID=A0A914XEK6_9BILA
MADLKTFSIPYHSHLSERIEPGQTLIVKGQTFEDSKRFSINFQKDGVSNSVDIPLHLSIRFDENKVVLNSLSKGEWGKEERKKVPFKKGEPFDIRIRAHDNKFVIFCDRKEFEEFEYRLPLTHITHMSIDGDIALSNVHWGGKYYAIPYESDIAGNGLAPGKTLIIYATPEKKAKRFSVNLLKRNGDVALHFNSRFDEKAVIRNSQQAGDWGNEEREGKIPFEKSVGFDLAIKNEPYAYQIFVNGERFCTFAHRCDPHDITKMQIDGDLEVAGIQII